MSFECRVMQPADVRAYRDLRRLGIQLFPKNFLLTLEAHDERSDASEAETLGQGNIHGVFDGDRLIGIAGLRQSVMPTTTHRAEIGPYLVHPDYHGTSAANDLMAALRDVAHAKGIWQLELYVHEDNIRGQAFYARHGFVQVGTLPNVVVVDGAPQTDLFMVCDLRG